MSDAPTSAVEAALKERVPDPGTLAQLLDGVGYLADEGLATALFLGIRLQRPVLLEGEPGVGKTEAARALSEALSTPLIRLQCYEGIDVSEALYEWNYPRQLLAIRMAESRGAALQEAEMFGDDYLLRRPLLRALEHPGPFPLVLLVDEVDRSDHEFEAFLFELLGDASITIPERGTIRASCPPIVILTSNRTRELHDALKRRCLYHWIDYPSPEREMEIVLRRSPRSSPELARAAAAAAQRLRSSDVQKPPGIAEVIDWVGALELLGADRLDASAAASSLGAVLKYREDEELVRSQGMGWLVGEGGDL